MLFDCVEVIIFGGQINRFAHELQRKSRQRDPAAAPSRAITSCEGQAGADHCKIRSHKIKMARFALRGSPRQVGCSAKLWCWKSARKRVRVVPGPRLLPEPLQRLRVARGEVAGAMTEPAATPCLAPCAKRQSNLSCGIRRRLSHLPGGIPAATLPPSCLQRKSDTSKS